MIIEFAQDCGLSPQDRQLIRHWPTLHARLQKRDPHHPLSTSRVIVRGAGIVGSDASRTIIVVDVRVLYESQDQTTEHSYHLSILPPTAALFFIFHDTGSNAAIQAGPTVENLHLVIVRQPRWAAHTSNSPEPPSGFSENGETPFDAAWREAREEIGEELFDKLCRNYTSKPLTASDLVPFCRIDAPDATLSSLQEAFACVVPVTSGQLQEIRRHIAQCSGGGLVDEGEATRPDLLSLANIIDEAKLGMISFMIIEFMRSFGIQLPARKHILPLPCIRSCK